MMTTPVEVSFGAVSIARVTSTDLQWTGRNQPNRLSCAIPRKCSSIHMTRRYLHDGPWSSLDRADMSDDPSVWRTMASPPKPRVAPHSPLPPGVRVARSPARYPSSFCGQGGSPFSLIAGHDSMWTKKERSDIDHGRGRSKRLRQLRIGAGLSKSEAPIRWPLPWANALHNDNSSFRSLADDPGGMAEE
jgi:hypothetical protein